MNLSAQRIFVLVTVAFVVMAAFLGARITSQVIAERFRPEIAPPAAPEPARKRVTKRPPPPRTAQADPTIFGGKPTQPKAPDAESPAESKPEPEPEPPKLNLNLVAIGVRSLGTSFVVLESGEGPKIVHVGEEVESGAKLAEVKHDRMFVMNGKHRQEYRLFEDRSAVAEEGGPQGRAVRDPKADRARAAAANRPSRASRSFRSANSTTPEGSETIRQVSPTSFVVDRREVENATANMGQLMTQIRVVPSLGDGNQTEGFKVFAIRPSSIFAKLGIRNGDVLKEVNGIPLSGVDQAYQALTGLQGESNIQVNLIRKNEPLTLSFEIR